MLRVLNQVGRNIMLEQSKKFNMGTLYWDSGFSVLPQMAENGSKFVHLAVGCLVL